jgi:hypothetical protein
LWTSPGLLSEQVNRQELWSVFTKQVAGSKLEADNSVQLRSSAGALPAQLLLLRSCWSSRPSKRTPGEYLHKPPQNWRFSTNRSGWTSDCHDGHDAGWLATVFEPLTKQTDPIVRRLLIMNGHSSHITANMVALRMRNVVDLLILSPHCSHLSGHY